MRETISNLTKTELYGFGSNGAGQLGVGHRDDLSEPQVCQFQLVNAVESSDGQHSPAKTYLDGRIRSIVAGGNHTLLLTEEGSLYASGNNEDGRCALPTYVSDLCAFTHVPWAQSRNVTHIASTWETSFFVQDAHIIWVSGSGMKGELGLGKEVLLASSPRVALDIWDMGDQACEIVSITGGMSHIVVLLSNGHVYGWGSCRKGQLGDDRKNEKILWQPQKLHLSGPINNIVAGRDFTAIVGPDHNPIVFGDLKSGGEFLQPEPVKPPPEFLAGWSTLYMLSDGHVQGYGLGRRGQLPPPNLPPVIRLSAGSEHCVALTASKQVITWGWGEHGNCGMPIDDRSCVAERFNLISIPNSGIDSIVGIATGCASSFVWAVSSS